MSRSILVVPVSGGYFVNQVGALYHLAKHGYRPDIIMGGSGGVVASMIFVCANYDPTSMIRTAREVRTDIYIKSWVPKPIDFISSKLIGFFRGSLYDNSELLLPTIKKMVTPAMLNEIEMWILAFNASKGEPGLFCTCSSDKAIIHSTDGHLKLYKTLTYMDGCVDFFTKVATASACIPSVVPPICINGDNYADAGLVHSSPLTPLSIDVQHIDQWHIIYLSCYNMDILAQSNLDGSIIDTVGYATKTIIDSNIQTDRYKCYEMLLQRGKVYEEKMSLEEYFKRRDDWFSSVMEIYPLTDNKVDLSNFVGDDVVNIMLNTEIGIRVWYVISKATCFGVK